MGSSKRHKGEKNREMKKKRHRSRSHSYSPESERSEKHRHHKKHKKKGRKDYDSDVEIVSAPPPPKISRTVYLSTTPMPLLLNLNKDARNANHREDRYYNHKEEKYSCHAKAERISRQRRSQSPLKSGQSQSSISIEETNRIRAKLGLKPLEVDPDPKEGSNIIKDDLGEFHHKPAANLIEKEKTQKLKEKITVMKEKRKIEASLAAVKTLGESDSENDTVAWVKKSRIIEEEKKKAAERAKLLDQMDEEFGLESLIKEVNSDLRNAYTDRDLKGLKVEHNLENFKEGNNIILTLKDKTILAEDEDVLVNINMIDDERYKKNVLIKSKKPSYDAYNENNYNECGMLKSQVLEKYDEEIEGEKRETFTIGAVDPKEIRERQAAIIKNKLANKRLESLVLAEPKLANDYYNEQELFKFKKVRKKVHNKKKLKLREIADYLKDLGSRRPRREVREERTIDTLDNLDIEPPKEDLSRIEIEEEDRDFDLKIKPKTTKLKEPLSILKPEKIAMMIKEELDISTEINSSSNIVLNSTAEFCRTLGDIPTYGQAGNRDENQQEFVHFQLEDNKHDPLQDDEMDGRGAWNTVRVSDEILREPSAMKAAILDVEPSLDQGVGGALRLAMSKGYLQKEDSNRPSASRFAHLKAQNYSIEDKTYGDDDKFGKRDRFNGPTSDFKEKEGFRPNVKLEYIDDDGHVLNAKEAFRYLSHKFHGKGPGKNKIEKRMKQAEQDILMKRMSSTDTPLGTLTLLQAKQKETQSPFIVLSGSKQIQPASISKSKN